MRKIPRPYFCPTTDSNYAHVERECFLTVLACGKAVREGRMSRRQFGFARTDLLHAREDRRWRR